MREPQASPQTAGKPEQHVAGRVEALGEQLQALGKAVRALESSGIPTPANHEAWRQGLDLGVAAQALRKEIDNLSAGASACGSNVPGLNKLNQECKVLVGNVEDMILRPLGELLTYPADDGDAKGRALEHALPYLDAAGGLRPGALREWLDTGIDLHAALGEKAGTAAASRADVRESLAQAFSVEGGAAADKGAMSLLALMMAVMVKATGLREDEIDALAREQQKKQAQMADLQGVGSALERALGVGTPSDTPIDCDHIAVPLHPASPLRNDPEFASGTATVAQVIGYYRQHNPEFNLPAVPATVGQAALARTNIGSTVTVLLQGPAQNELLQVQDLYARYREFQQLTSNVLKTVHDAYMSTIR